jgi:hypothetical protein
MTVLRSSTAEINAELERFRAEFGPLIERVALVQRQLQHDPRVQRLAGAGAGARIGPDGQLDEASVELAARLIDIPEVAALGSSAASMGCRGMGILTANVEAGLIIGGQAGAELVWLWPYKIGSFRTPNRLVGRAWTTVTIGLDLGVSLTAVPFPLDLSFWFVPPEDSNHMAGAFLEYVTEYGVRVEIFGWVPEKANTPAPELSISPFQYIFGFRVVAEVGVHVGIGVALKGKQTTTSDALDLSTYYITPTNIEAGKKYDGSDSLHPLVAGVVTAPRRDQAPSKILRTGTSTLSLTFPSWLCSGLSSPPPPTFTNDGSGGSGGWTLTGKSTTADLTYDYQWVGPDATAWTDDIAFTIMAASKDTPPQNGKTTCQLKGLDNVGAIDVPVSIGGNLMYLVNQVFAAAGTADLVVDTNANSIEGVSGSTASVGVNATTADGGGGNTQNFYYLTTPGDPSQPLTIIDVGTSDQWYCGYQFQQQNGSAYAQFRAVFWKYGTRFNNNNIYVGNWQTLSDPTQYYVSVATWSGGAVTNGTTLTVSLKPIAS